MAQPISGSSSQKALQEAIRAELNADNPPRLPKMPKMPKQRKALTNNG